MNYEYCKCEGPLTVYTVEYANGYWDYCDNCDKRIEDSHHFDDESDLY